MTPVLMIDNFDSFTFNLAEAFQRIGCRVTVLRNSVGAAEALACAVRNGALIVLSPGPGRPEDAGCCLELIGLARARVPLLGICLGHQAIVQEAGGQVTRAPRPVHGKSSRLAHDGEGPFRGLPQGLQVGRYHSLCTREVPPRFQVHARCEEMAMAISDRKALQTGLQFHPESILTRDGDAMLANILTDAAQALAEHPIDLEAVHVDGAPPLRLSHPTQQELGDAWKSYGREEGPAPAWIAPSRSASVS